MAGFLDRINNSRRIGFSEKLRKLSKLNIEYEDLIQNSRIPGRSEVDTSQIKKSGVRSLGNQKDDIYDDPYQQELSALTSTDVGVNQSISYYNQNYLKRREELNNFAEQDEIEDALDIILDEAVVYDNKNFFAYPEVISGEVDEEIKKEYEKIYYNIYNYLGFHETHTANDFMQRLLVEGYVALEILFDKTETKIIGFKNLDPYYLIPFIDKFGYKYWTYEYGNQKEQIPDSKIIYISYSNSNTKSRFSYVERLIRSFNLLRIMETTRIIWAVMNSSFKMKFIIPVGRTTKNRAQESLNKLKNRYRQNIDFDFESGNLQVNGKSQLPFNNEYWIPRRQGEQPEIESMNNDGPDLSDTESLNYFKDKFKLATKIPFNRFNHKEGGGEYRMAADGVIRDEIRFSNFISSLRSKFQEIIVKPCYIQMILNYPHLKDDLRFKSQLGMRWNKQNMFEELKQMEIMERRVDFISNMKDSLVTVDENLDEEPFFNLRFLVEKYLKMDPDDLEQNEKYKKEEEGKKEESDDDSEFGL